MRSFGPFLLLTVFVLPGCCLARTLPPVYPPVLLPSGVQVRDIIVPIDAGPEARIGDRIELHYELSLGDGTPIDSSWDRGVPVAVQLGDGQLPRGVEEGVVGMRRFGKRELTVPPDMGYGAAGQAPSIPPDAILLLILDLMGLESGDGD